jgi:hypothetical protein
MIDQPAARKPRHVPHAAPDRLTVAGTRRAPAWTISIWCLGAVTFVVLFVVAIQGADNELLHALTIAPILILLTVPLAFHIAKREGDPTLAGIVMAGAIAKLLGALVRYYVAYVVYSGVSDATQYDQSARQLAPDFRRLIFSLEALPERDTFVGTNFARVVTGVEYAIFGAGKIAGFLVFSWLAFLGLLLFARAFRIGVPGGDGRRYLILVLFLPSLVYWPSAIGKEAWMILGLGLCSYGIACFFRRRSTGALALVPGLFAVMMMRPHLGLVLFVGLVFAMLVRKSPARSYAAPLARIIGLGALLVLGLILAGQTASFLGQESLTTESVSVELNETGDQTGEGGSAFTPVRVNTPLDLLPAFVTVYFRPFVFEVDSAQGLLTAGEGALLVVIAIASWRRLRSIPRLLRTTPYVAFAIGYVLAFTYAFSSFGNFGILARQRSQALPLLLVLFALPLFGTTSDTQPRTPTKTARRPAPGVRSLSPGTPRRRSRRQAGPREVAAGPSVPAPPRRRGPE